MGCKLNQLESEAIAGSFLEYGFTVIPYGQSFTGPEIKIINTCTVTSKADQKARRVIRKALRDNPEACVLVTGCYAQLDRAEIEKIGDEYGNTYNVKRLFVAGTGKKGSGEEKSSILKLPRYLQEKLASMENPDLPFLLESWAAVAESDTSFSYKPHGFTFHSRAYLKIQDGCNGSCTYCRTRIARGSGVSLPAEEALEQLRYLEADAYAELMITGVNISQYSHGACNLARLIKFLLEGSNTIALRLSSLEPEGITEELISVIANPRVRPSFHLSIQSGSNTILQKMGRVYTSETVEKAAFLLRSAKNNPFLACDIISGFPGETCEDFNQTLELCKKIDFAWIHAFPYSKRPGTAAADYAGHICEKEVTNRVNTLHELAVQGRKNYTGQWLGKEITAVVEKQKTQSGQCCAVSENYLKLIVNYDGGEPVSGSLIRCVPFDLCENSDGERPDAVANIIN